MNSKMNIRLLIPIKSLDKVKSRLSEEIEDKFRIGLSLAMLDHVIQTGIRASEFEDVLVVGGDEMISHLCHMAKCSWLPQPEGTNGLNETVDLIFNSTVLEGFDGLLYLPADLPELGISDLNGMMRETNFGKFFTLCPDRHGTGTNALFIPNSSRFKCQLGENSFVNHNKQMTQIGEKLNIYNNSGIGFDIDNLEDFNLLLDNYPNWRKLIEEYYKRYIK
ncbi:MAG: 2-phospho-L-lactate guanylyltransferase [Chloroflexi bacterium]|nr:2-phospho-L-lactate guanylyltransferase [Chloroflexota bacterium]|tara:strand:+ start:10227 stop:10886 length:660 start_codon:yes stop_codon:yes gene_type:complete